MRAKLNLVPKKQPRMKWVDGPLYINTVGVAGSIPVEPTISKLRQRSKIIEIPEEYDVIPAVEWQGFRPRLFRVLIRKTAKGIKRGSNKDQSA